MWIQIFLAVAGACAGIAVAVAALAFINALSIAPRMAAKTKTANFLVFYENISGIGLLAGTVLSIFDPTWQHMGWLVPIMGLSIGIFVGNLIMGLTEVMDVFPVLFRRIRLKEGLTIVILIVALGKMSGSLAFFLLKLIE